MGRVLKPGTYLGVHSYLKNSPERKGGEAGKRER